MGITVNGVDVETIRDRLWPALGEVSSVVDDLSSVGVSVDDDSVWRAAGHLSIDELRDMRDLLAAMSVGLIAEIDSRLAIGHVDWCGQCRAPHAPLPEHEEAAA